MVFVDPPPFGPQETAPHAVNVGGAEIKNTVVFQDPPDLPERPFRILKMLDHVVHHDRVKMTVRKNRLFQGSVEDIDPEILSAVLPGPSRKVHTLDLPSLALGLVEKERGPAADVQHAAMVLELAYLRQHYSRLRPAPSLFFQVFRVFHTDIVLDDLPRRLFGDRVHEP